MPRLPSFAWKTAVDSAVRWTSCPPHQSPSPSLEGHGLRFPPVSDCRNFRTLDLIVPLSPSTPPVILSPGTRRDPLFSRLEPRSVAELRFRHGTCKVRVTVEKSSQWMVGSVNSVHRSAKSVPRAGDRSKRRCGVEQARSWWRRGWNHGAARNGYRKRTRVRVACGVTIRPRGVGTLSSHGHFGRSVDGAFLSPVVCPPLREEHLRRGHFSSSPGLPAAALTLHPVGFVRMPAQGAGSISWATRPRRAVVNRATSAPAQPAGLSGGWARRTRPDPRTRLQRV